MAPALCVYSGSISQRVGFKKEEPVDDFWMTENDGFMALCREFFFFKKEKKRKNPCLYIDFSPLLVFAQGSNRQRLK